MPGDEMANPAEIETPGTGGEGVPNEGEGLDELIAKVIKAVVADKSLDPKTRQKKVLQALKLHPAMDDGGEPSPEMEPEMSGGEEEEPEEEPEVAQTGEATDPTGGIRPAGGSGTERLGGETGSPTGGEIPAKNTKVFEAIEDLKKSGDKSLIDLAESFSQQLAADSKKERELTDELDRYKAMEAYQKKVSTGKKLCKELNLQEALVTDVFLKELASKKTEGQMKELIEDRKAVYGTRKPQAAASHIGRADPGKIDPVTGKPMKDMSAEKVASIIKRR